MRVKVLREEFAGKLGEGGVMGGWTKLHNLCPLFNGTRVVKSKQAKWAMHVEGTGMFRKS